MKEKYAINRTYESIKARKCCIIAAFPGKIKERETGFEPATFALARRRSTPEPLALIVLSALVFPANKWNNTIPIPICQLFLSFFAPVIVLIHAQQQEVITHLNKE